MPRAIATAAGAYRHDGGRALGSAPVEILDVETTDRDGRVHVALRGELDLSTVGKVQDELRRVEASSPPVLVLDLSKLTFLDSTGLRCLVTADERGREAGRRVVIVRGPGARAAGVLDHPPRGAPGHGRRRRCNRLNPAFHPLSNG